MGSGLTAGLTAAFALLASAGFQLSSFEGDALDLLYSAIIFAFIGWGIQRMSRAAAIAGLGLYILDRISIWLVDGPNGAVIIVPLILTSMFINSIRGTYQYQKMINSRLNVRNVFILSGLGLLYSLGAFVMTVRVLRIAADIGVDVEAINDTLLGSVILSGMLIVYVLTLMRRMPLTKGREMVETGGGIGVREVKAEPRHSQ